MTRRDLLRALIALDPWEPSEAALEAVKALAFGQPTELEGLLIEDVNVHRLAELPFVRVLGSWTRSERRLDREILSRQLEVQTARIRHRFEEASKRLELEASFRIERGTVESEVHRAAQQADLVVITRGKSAGLTLRGAQARRLDLEHSCTVVYVRKAWRAGRSIVVLFEEEDERGRSLLRTAVRLSRAENLPLVVLLAKEGDGGRRLQESALRILGEETGREVAVRFRAVRSTEVEGLALAANQESALALVLASDDPRLEEGGLEELLESSSCALVLSPTPGPTRTQPAPD